MSEWDELPFTDLNADPEAAATPGQRMGGLRGCQASNASRLRRARAKAHALVSTGAASDTSRADRVLRRFSWEDGE